MTMKKMTMKRLMENYSDEIVRMTEARMSADDIAAVIGCNEKTVLRARELLEAF